jgi:uncharacterized repeat protein (TIGR01451 family)
VEVFERGIWGTDYRVPVGANMPTSSASSTLTWDSDIFSYTALSIMAGAGGATVQVDADNNGTFEQTFTLAEGGSRYVTGVNVGGRVTSDKPVQVVLFAGRPTSNYQSRDTSLLPVNRWSSTYYAPMSSVSANGSVVFLYNPGASAITVSYDTRSSTSTYTTATVSVPARGNARVSLTAGLAYKFYTTGTNPAAFYAFCAIDANSTDTGNNQAYDGGFTLVGQPSLTTQVLVSLGIGRDPYSATNPSENGNPVWVTTVGNGHTPETVYVDFNGDNAGPLTDPNGNRYDVSYSLRELQQQKILDPDGDQSGMVVYVLSPSVKLAAVWAQDPSLATASQPGLDVATLIPPLREGGAGKGSSLAVDVGGDGHVSPGDTLEYNIRVINTARTAINGPFAVTDTMPPEVDYLAGTTKYRFSVNGAWQAWLAVPDDGTGTPFPLDGTGYGVPGTLNVAQQIEVVFKARIKSPQDLAPGTTSITNTGAVEVTPYGLVIGLTWTDQIYGSIGDRVWVDANGNGNQDTGETGLNGVVVYADINNNGVLDAGEPSDTTAGDGDYVLGGLPSGTYTVRLDPSSVAALNPGYGPTYDLDGIATAYVASVPLAAGQDRVDADFGLRVGASVGDRVWLDRNNNGVQDSGEPGINGVRVFIDANANNIYEAGERNAITFGDGTYHIGNLDAGNYTVVVDATTLPAGITQTYDLDGTGTANRASLALAGAQHRGDVDFGYRGNLSIGDLVWEDVDADGARVTYNVYSGRIDINNSGGVGSGDDGMLAGIEVIDGYLDLSGSGFIGSADDGVFLGITVIDGALDMNGSGGITSGDTGTVHDEGGISGVRVYIDANGNGTWESTEAFATTDARGAYTIGNLYNGTYTVRVDTTTLPPSLAQTHDLTSPTDDDTATVALSGASRTDVDFGYRNDATIGDRVWNDRNNNGVQDAGEPGIEGVLVYIDANGNSLFDQATERYVITDVNGYYLFDNLAAGTFSIRVEISTLPRASVQTYDLDGLGSANGATRTITVSEDAWDVDFGYRSTASVGDFVWLDADADGVQDSGESGINGVRVYLDINGNDIFESATEPSALTAGNGAYSIGGLVAGTYTARVDASTLPAGMVLTYDLVGDLDNAATFMLSPGQARTDLDFGYTQPVSIGDLVWNDLNANGVQDGGEPGIDGVEVTVWNAAAGTIADTTTTAGGGLYAFNDLLPGSYYVVFGTPVGYTPTLSDQGNDGTDSDAAVSTGRTPNVTLLAGQSNLTLDAGYYQPSAVGDFVWNDANANGQQDGGETGLAGATVTLYRPGFGPDGIPGNTDDAAAVATQTTATDGAYSFSGLAPGTYQIHFGPRAGYNRTPADQGADASDSDANPATGRTADILLAAGDTNQTIDAGYYQPGSITGTVWADIDNDDTGDTGIGGVTLTLVDGSGNPVDGDPVEPGLQPVTTTTAPDGTYSFPGLRPGTYGVVETQPSGYLSVTDKDGGDPDQIRPVTVTAGTPNTGNDFVEEQPGSITGTVWADIDNDDTGDTGIGGVTLTLVDGSGNPVDGDPVEPGLQPVTTTTAPDGTYSFPGLRPGTYGVVETQPSGYLSVTDKDGGDPDQIRPVTVTAGTPNTGNDFIEEQPGSISGSVLADTDNNDSGDTGIGGVTLTLVDGSGNPIDGDPVAPGLQPVTTTTAPDGTYSFAGLRPGTYGVLETQPSGYLSVSDKDGGDPDEIRPIAVVPGEANIGNDFIEEQPGSIGNLVWIDANHNGVYEAGTDWGINGITVQIFEAGKTPGVDDPVATQTTSGGGLYQFTDLPPGDYFVYLPTHPAGLPAVTSPSVNADNQIDNDNNGSQSVFAGPITGPVVSLGSAESDQTIDIGFACQGTWEEWRYLNPLGGQNGATDNPEADRRDNLLEFALRGDPSSGIGDGFEIRPSTTNPGTIEAVFNRPIGAIKDMRYVLEYAATLGTPTVWGELDLSGLTLVITPISACTEQVIIPGLEAITGLTGGKGFVRIRVELDEDGDDTPEVIRHAETEGWTETGIELCCRTYNNPYLRGPLFNGTVGSVSAQQLVFPGETLDNLLASGVSYYVEVTSGDNEGHRYDVVSVSGNTITLANDTDLFSVDAPHNTVLGAPPANLAGDTVILRRHWTLEEIFPPSGFGATDSSTTADMVQMHVAGTWQLYWLYDEGDSNPATARWVKVGDNTLANQGGLVVAPGQGMFLNSRNTVGSILAYGEVRENDFRRPLQAGPNLVGGGYPIDQSLNGTGGRNMNLAANYDGDRDFKKADRVMIWQQDTNPAGGGYDTYFLLDGAPVQPALVRWVKVGDAQIQVRDTTTLFPGDRAAFYQMMGVLPGDIDPAPWTP